MYCTRCTFCLKAPSCFHPAFRTGSAFAMGYKYIDGPCAFGSRGGNPPKTHQVPVHTQSSLTTLKKTYELCMRTIASRPVRLCLSQTFPNSSCDKHYLHVDILQTCSTTCFNLSMHLRDLYFRNKLKASDQRIMIEIGRMSERVAF
ncbi:hypothetical protein F4776DRAFT_504661 [Hypoxylon sp. NC0597]|nr:hypothetical protein F4776DRAFT_504661 [Hypoxylon sp. NC0597]